MKWEMYKYVYFLMNLFFGKCLLPLRLSINEGTVLFFYVYRIIWVMLWTWGYYNYIYWSRWFLVVMKDRKWFGDFRTAGIYKICSES